MKGHSTIRILCLLLALCLMPLTMAAGAADEPPREYFGSLLSSKSEQLQGYALLKGDIYALSSNALYLIRGGQGKPEKISDIPSPYDAVKQNKDAITSIFAIDGRLMGFNNWSGIWYELQVKDGKLQYAKQLALNWEEFTINEGDYSYVQGPDYVLPYEGRLYLKLTNHGGERAQDLYSYDLSTGEVLKHSPRHLSSLTPYKDGKLLGLHFDQNARDEKTNRPQLPVVQVFDPKADSVQALNLTLPPDSENEILNRNLMLYYDVAQDQIYGVEGGGMWRLKEGEAPVKVARLPMPGQWIHTAGANMVQPLEGRELLIGLGANLFRRSSDESRMQPARQLKAHLSDFDQRVVTQVLLEHDDIELVPSQLGWLNGEKIGQLFLTGEMDLDLLSLRSDDVDVTRLMLKEYLLPLDANAQLKKLGENSYDAFKRLMYAKDQLLLLPADLQTNGVTAFPQRFQEIGKEVPKSVDELIDFADWLAREGAQAHPGYVIFDMQLIKEGLRMLAYDRYVDSQAAQGIPLKFTMEDFGQLMQRIDRIPSEEMDAAMQQGMSDENYYLDNKIMLYASVGYDVTAGTDSGPDGTQWIDLPLMTGMPEYRRGSASLLAIPATSKEPELARRFLASYYNHLQDMQKALLFQDWTKPIENPNYERELEQTRSALENMQATYEKEPEGARKRELAESIERVKKQLERAGERRYLVSEAGLASHRAVMQTVYLDGSMELTQRQALTKDGYLFGTYDQGAISLEQFIQQANERIRLMTLEMQ